MPTPVEARAAADRLDEAAGAAASLIRSAYGDVDGSACAHRRRRPASHAELPDPEVVAEAQLCTGCGLVTSIRLRRPN